MARRRVSERIGAGAVAIAAAWRAVLGADELLVVVGLVLLTAGLWPIADQGALVAPGLVLLWIALPQRTSFVIGASEKRPSSTPPHGGA